MKNSIQLLLSFLLVASFGLVQAQVTSRVEVGNQVTIGNEHYFDVFVYSGINSSPSELHLAGSDFVFTYSTTNVPGGVTFEKVDNPAPPEPVPSLFVQNGYCNFSSTSHVDYTNAWTAFYVQGPTHSTTVPTVTMDNLLVVNFLGASPTDVTSFNNNVPLLKCYDAGFPEKNRFGRFKIVSGAPITASPEITLKTSGSGLFTKIFTFETTAPYATIKANMESNYCAILPIELSRFEATKLDNEVQLDWTTQSEIDHSHYEIQRSADGENWTNIGRQSSTGNSLETRYYDFLDRAPMSGINYYRLKSVDLDESIQYSEIRVVKMTTRAVVTIISIYPNPAKDAINITLPSDRVEGSSLQLFDVSGRMVKDLGFISIEKDQVALSLTGLPAGVYFLKSQNGEEVTATKFVKR